MNDGPESVPLWSAVRRTLYRAVWCLVRWSVVFKHTIGGSHIADGSDVWKDDRTDDGLYNSPESVTSSVPQSYHVSGRPSYTSTADLELRIDNLRMSAKIDSCLVGLVEFAGRGRSVDLFCRRVIGQWFCDLDPHFRLHVHTGMACGWRCVENFVFKSFKNFMKISWKFSF